MQAKAQYGRSIEIENIISSAQSSHSKLCALHNNSSSIRKTTRRGGARRSPARIAPAEEPKKPQMPDFANKSFTNIIYTKLSTFTSRKIS